MANLFRLILFAVFALCGFAAQAEDLHWGISPGACTHSTPIAACVSAYPLTKYASGGTAEVRKCQNDSETFGSAYYTAVCSPPPPTECTANAERVNGVCQCKVGFKEGLGGCQFDGKKACEAFAALETLPGGVLVKDIALKGRVEDSAVFCMPLVGDEAGIASAGCRVAFNQTMVATNHDSSITSYGTWGMSASPTGGTGDYSCSTAEPLPPKQPDKPKCTNGAPGTVNGVEVCVPRQADTGVESGVKDTTETNDGEKTTKKENNSTTVCKDGKCTTTTVTTTTVTNNSTGASTTSSSTSTAITSKDDFCGKNPKNAQCNGTGTGTGSGGGGNGDGEKEPSEFGGACAAGFQCKGDAIQCAIAREQHARACKMFDDSSPESQLYDANKGKTGSQTGELEGNETVDMLGRIDTSDALGGGGGVRDLHLTVWGRSATLPLSDLNGPLGILGNLLVAVSFLIAVRIIGRG